MVKLSEIFAKLKDMFKSMSTARKIAFGIIFSVIIASIILYGSYSKANKYGVLFSNLTPEDGKAITEQLTQKKVDKVVKDNTIYVPKDQVAELRLELAGNLSGGSKGYELMDTGNSFGMTDEEFKLNKLRATQGELERTIKAFPQVENTRVHITPAEESVFVKDAKPAKAAVYLKLRPGTKLNPENVRSIMALVAGSVANLAKDNIEVIDDKMNLLSKNVLDENSQDYTTSIEKQQSAELDFEKKLENALMDMLEPAIGKGKVNVKVNTDLDFDAKEKTVLTYDPNKVEASTQTSKETDSTGSNSNSQSPVDNNMSNTTPAGQSGNSSTKETQTNNYKVGQTESKTISAPGEVKRITASVIIDGKLDEATKGDIQKLVAGVIGYKQDRNDEINIIGMTFDPTVSQQQANEFKLMEQEAAKKEKMQLITTIATAAAVLLALVIFFIILLKMLKRKKTTAGTKSIDVVIDEAIPVKEAVNYPPINFDVDNEKSHLEQELKKYATEKPEQVADIIKSWLAEDER